MINNKVKARPAEKPLVQTHQEPTTDIPKGLNKIEGIITSKIELKYQNNQPYYLAFFALEGISNQDIPVIFKLDSSENLEQNQPNIPPRAKVLLEGK